MEADDLRFVGRVPTELRLLPVGIKARLEDAFDNPVFLMANPAFALLVFDNGDKCWTRTPLDAWTRCADDVSWSGVLPADQVYDCGSAGAVSCMVALKTSPIWKRLGEAGDCVDSRTGGNANFLISNVGRREWRRFCAVAGVADGLDTVRRVAFAVEDVQERIGGKGAYGTGALPESIEASRIVARSIVNGKDEGARPKFWLSRLIDSIFS